MQILLKELLNEVSGDEVNPLEVQLYCDMDGVLADMEGGFKRISGGTSLKDYEETNGKNSFWKKLGAKDRQTGKPFNPNFWLDLKPMPDAMVLWDFIKENFKNPAPVILSAGQGARLIEQKTQWIHNHLGPNIKVIIADAGSRKPNYILKYPEGRRVTHLLLDDTQRNITIWDDPAQHRVAILHTSAASSIEQLKNFLPEIK